MDGVSKGGFQPAPQKPGSMDTAALVVSIIALLTCSGFGILGIVGAILAIIVLTNSRYQSKTKAIVSLVLSGISLLVFVFSLIFGAGLIASLSGEQANGDNSAVISSDVASSDVSSSDTSEEVSKEESNSETVDYVVTDTHFTYYTNSIGDIEYYGYVEIENTGSSNLYLDDCTFDLEDDDGHLLQSESFISTCPDIIAPGEKGYFYNGLGSNLIDDEVSLDNGVNLVPHFKVEKAKGDIVEYEVFDTSLRKNDYGSQTVTGRVKNTSDKDESMLYINIIFYDKDGKVLSIGGTNVLDLKAGDTQSFECTGMFGEDIDFDDIADYKVIARAMYYQF